MQSVTAGGSARTAALLCVVAFSWSTVAVDGAAVHVRAAVVCGGVVCKSGLRDTFVCCGNPAAKELCMNATKGATETCCHTVGPVLLACVLCKWRLAIEWEPYDHFGLLANY